MSTRRRLLSIRHLLRHPQPVVRNIIRSGSGHWNGKCHLFSGWHSCFHCIHNWAELKLSGARGATKSRRRRDPVPGTSLLRNGTTSSGGAVFALSSLSLRSSAGFPTKRKQRT